MEFSNYTSSQRTELKSQLPFERFNDPEFNQFIAQAKKRYDNVASDESLDEVMRYI
jgi:hypothetical protein